MNKKFLWLLVSFALLIAAATLIRSRVGPPPINLNTERTSGIHESLRQDGIVPHEVLQPQKPSIGRLPDNSDYARETFDLLVVQHRKVRSRLKGDISSNRNTLAWAKAFGYVQARLLALGYPEETEALVTRILADPNASQDDLLFVAKILGFLASQKRTFAESGLVRLSESQDTEVATTAVETLLANDKEGRYRAVYWKKCSEGNLEVYDLGPQWADGQTKQMLQHIYERDNTPESPDTCTKEALERLAILESPARSEMLEQLVSGRAETGDYTKIYQRQRWALQAIQMNPSNGVAEILRQRLERDEIAAATFHKGSIYEPPGPTQPGLVHATGDEYYDEVLLAYQALGGKLNTNQTQRLTFYGYLGDPKERLNALMSEGK